MTRPEVDVVVVRTPTWPVELLEQWLAHPEPVAGLREVFADPLAQDALAVASLDVLSACDTADDLEPALVRTLVRYLTRMTLRPTPFGLFATASVGSVGDRTHLPVAPPSALRVSARLDAEVVRALVTGLRADPEVRAALRWRANPTAHESAGKVRYVETRSTDTGVGHHLVAAPAAPALLQALALAQSITLDELADALAPALGEDLEAVRSYVEQLADAQLLVDDLQMAVTGPSPEEQLCERLPSRHLASLAVGRAALDAPARWAERLRDVAEALGRPASSMVAVVDASRPSEGLTLGPTVVDQLTRGAELLRRLWPPAVPHEISRFAATFTERWEGRWIPLLQALDPEVGLRFDTGQESAPLLAGLALGGPRAPGVQGFGSAEAHQLQLLLDAADRGAVEIDLTEDDLARLAAPRPGPMPTSWSALFWLSATSAEAIDSGDAEIFLRNVNGPSGGRLLGRFAQGNPDLVEPLRTHHRREQELHPDAILAEVVHLPEGRTGNVIGRPVLRDHEIVLLAGSGVDEAHQLHPADLLVGVVHGEVQLRRAADGRRVLPRMTTAHDYFRGNIGLYRFLCQLQNSDGSQPLSWAWGPLASAAFLPRVRSGRLVLSLATWNLSERDRTQLSQGSVAELRDRLRLPRWVMLRQGDLDQTLDLDHPLCADVFVDAVAKGATQVLEVWPPLDRLPAGGPHGRHVMELVAAFTTPVTTTEPATSLVVGGVTRHLPGGEWLYVKAYCGTATADAVLQALTPSLKDQEWHFLRYADPDHHLRIRVRHGTDVLPALHAVLAVLVEQGAVQRVQVDTYVPEVDRYGGHAALPLVEQCFAVDSGCAADVLEMLSEGDLGADERWRLCLASMDLMWRDTGLPIDVQDRLIACTARDFAAEQGLEGERSKPIGQRMRTERERLEAVMARSGDDLGPGYERLEQRSGELRPLFAQLRALDVAGLTGRSLEETASSIVHLSVNRWMRSQQRAQEAVLYALLTRLRRSQAARA